MGTGERGPDYVLPIMKMAKLVHESDSCQQPKHACKHNHTKTTCRPLAQTKHHTPQNTKLFQNVMRGPKQAERVMN